MVHVHAAPTDPCFSENTVKGMKMHMDVFFICLCFHILEVLSQSCVYGKISLMYDHFLSLRCVRKTEFLDILKKRGLCFTILS